MLEGDISSIAVNFANEQMTAASAAQGSFIRQVVRNLPSDHKEKILRVCALSPLTRLRVLCVISFCRCLLPRRRTLSSPVRLLEDVIKQGFEVSGFTPTVQPLKEFEYDYGLKTGEQDED
ncbi:hypothetical protein N7452_004254 [Penicillium brevicompactum]|uniref:Uncharacterized protein n=1 Tax=Penicillium brevicompactum TaxID=5074 RepID=A0A9W9QV13_PENBR|nr:hypothetical protein N7452_004254 [Penicillium brevicompactum]